MIPWDYDYVDERGVAHLYPWLLSWHCSIHDRWCNPFTRVSEDYLLGRAACNPTVNDDTFIVIAQAVEDRPIEIGGAP